MYGDYTYDFGQTDIASNGVLSGLLAVGAVFWVITLAIAILVIIAMWKIFTKAGKPGWAAIIPIYNTWVLFEICGLKGWYALLALIPFVGSIIVCVFTIIAYIKLAKAFGKETGFAVGMIFLPFVFLPILAFGKDNVYDASRIDSVTVNNTNTSNTTPTDTNNTSNNQMM